MYLLVPTWFGLAVVLLFLAHAAVDLLRFIRGRRDRLPTILVVDDASDEDVAHMRAQFEAQGGAVPIIVSASAHHRFRRLSAG